MRHGKAYFTLIELIVVTVASFIVLLPIATMMGAITRDWNTSREIKRLQEDVDLASYSVKGLIEEAYGYDIQDKGHIILIGSNAQTVQVYRDGADLIINNYAVINSLNDLQFSNKYEDGSNLPPRLIRVVIEAERSGRSYKNEFKVKLRN